MPEAYYEIISLGARYWFILLGVLIVLRSFLWLKKDRREKHRRLRQLPDAGTIGEMVVLEGNEELPQGATIPVPWEGVMGFVRGCDMIVPVAGVASRHCDVFFQNGVGLLVYPWRGCTVEIDGELVTNRKTARANPMHHGSCLKIGEATLRLRVFMGLETDRPAMMQADEEPMAETPQEDNAVYDQASVMWQQPYQPSEPYNGYPNGYAPNSYQTAFHQQETPYAPNPYANVGNAGMNASQGSAWDAPYSNQPTNDAAPVYEPYQDEEAEQNPPKRRLLRRRDRHA